MSTRKNAADNSQSCGCASCLVLFLGLLALPWIIALISAIGSLLVGFGPMILGALIAIAIERADSIPLSKKQIAATSVFLIGIFANAFLLMANPQLQPPFVSALLPPTPTPGAPTSNTQIVPPPSASPSTQASRATSAVPAAGALQIESARLEIRPLSRLRAQFQASQLTVRGRLVDVYASHRAEFVYLRWQVRVRNTSAQTAMQVEYAPLYYQAGGARLNFEADLKNSASAQIRQFGGLRKTTFFPVSLPPNATRTFYFNELALRSSAGRIRRAELHLTPMP